ncbi:MAG: hypothetical protein LBQ69_05545 [Treponema sp.]|nr:hypothetical protein [Treponema sp.]
MLLVLFIHHAAQGQEGKPLIQLNPFSINGIGTEESRLIVSLVRSYLSDIGNVIGDTRPARDAETPLAPEIAADYTISGTIRMEQDGHVFSVEITNTRTGERHSVSSLYKNSGEIALKTRSFMESAFAAGGLEAERAPARTPERLSENLVAGTWKGDAGIELIRLMVGGRGLAIFSSGAQMVLSYSIEGRTLKVWQVSPNSERYYYPLPLEAARQLAQGAEPMTWEFSMYEGGTVLSGLRVSTAARISGGAVTELLPGGDLREVQWTKTSL